MRYVLVTPRSGPGRPRLLRLRRVLDAGRQLPIGVLADINLAALRLHGWTDLRLVQKFLAELPYPVSKSQILEAARLQGVGVEVLRALDRLPERQYHRPRVIAEQLGRAA